MPQHDSEARQTRMQRSCLAWSLLITCCAGQADDSQESYAKERARGGDHALHSVSAPRKSEKE
eukprot:18707-Heterococcus_DN1.PRE.1